MSDHEGEERFFPLRQAYFYLTGDCNLRCRHCWIAPDYHGSEVSKAYLPVSVFRSVLTQGKPLGLTSVKLTGGEPLYHPDIEEILEVVFEEGLSLNVESNGVLCTPALARQIARCKDPFASVSLDGVDAATHEWVRGVDGCFDAAIEGIKNLVEAGLRPQVVMTVMRHNKDQIMGLIEFVAGIGVGSVKLNIVMPTARGQQMSAAGETLPIEELVELGRQMEAAKTPIQVFYSHPPAFRPLGNMFGQGGTGCGICGIMGVIGVLADGSYALCGIGESIPELVFGKAQTDRLEDVWRKSPCLREIREGMPTRLEGICGQCLMKNFCLGSCMAQNYYRKNNLWAPFWYCEEAYAKSLFPINRINPKNI